jgi:putative nucleotidyltransferase with HDIG domain
VETYFSGHDLAQLQSNHNSWLVAPGERVPEFLAPLVDEGMTAFLILPVHVDGQAFGAVICAHPRLLAVAKEDLEQTRQVADQLAVAFSNVQLIEALDQLHWEALSALARAIDAKSTWTAGHSERVTQVAVRIGRAMGLSPKDLQIMHRGGLLHDIGKIGTPPQILDKPGKLDPEEMQTMRDHVRIGMRILEPISGLAEALPIVAQHHEWFDGTGYPAGLAGEQISLHARIFAVADCYDAMISDRPYRRGMPRAKVIEIIERGCGTQFDPRVIEAFHRLCAEEPDLFRMPEQSEMVEQPA